jgi:hypothetical protein
LIIVESAGRPPFGILGAVARSEAHQLDVMDNITAGVLASLITMVILSDDAVFPGGAVAKWSLFGMLAGYCGLRLAVKQTDRPRMVGVAAFGVAGAYLLIRSTLLPPPGIPLVLQMANGVAAAAVLALAVYLALRWDRRGRHRRGGPGRRATVTTVARTGDVTPAR